MAKPRKYSWLMINDRVHCYRSPDDLQSVGRFSVAKMLTAYHDSELAQCTGVRLKAGPLFSKRRLS